MNIKNLYKGKLKYWYEQNYTYLHALYPAWLSDTLTYFMEKNKHYAILSPSANKGWHEEDAYHVLHETGYDLDFTIADMLGEEYYMDRSDYEKFHFLHKNQSVQELDNMETYDILIDCKGALWYAMHRRYKRNLHVMDLLIAYERLLKNETSILLIDGYQKQKYSTFMNQLISMFHLPIDKFREDSTLSLFHHVYASHSRIHFHSIPTQSMDKEKQASIDQMHMVYLTKTELRVWKTELQTRSRKRYSSFLKRSFS